MHYRTVLQNNERDCAPACLSMVAMYYGLKFPISKYRELLKTDKTGTNIYGIVDGAKQIGLDADALSGTPSELMSGIHGGIIKFPFIAHTVSSEGLLHFVVVFGTKKGSFLIGDPAKGKTSLSFDDFFQNWTGYIVTFEKTAGFKKGNHAKGSFLKFFGLLKGQYSKLATCFVLSIIISMIGIFGAFSFKIIMDNLTNATAYNIGKFFILLIFLYLLQAFIQLARGYLMTVLSKKIEVQLSSSYYNHIVDLPISSISTRQTGEYISRFSDTSKIRAAISNAVITILLDSLMVIGCGMILIFIDIKMFFAALIMVALYAVIVLIYRKPVENSNRQVMEKNAQLQSYFKESIDSLETVKAACSSEKLKEKMTTYINEFSDGAVKNSWISMTQDVLAETVEMIGTALILWIGFGLVSTNHVTIGELMTFYAMLAYFTSPIKNLVELQPTIQTAIVAAERLNDVLDLQKESDEEGKNTISEINTISFENVSFRYGHRELVLEDINLNIRKGEKIAIVGESGSGKTTLAKLLMRFYQPEKGHILINGENIDNIEMVSSRKKIAYIDQKTFLFSDTIKNNLCLNNPDITDEEIDAACNISQANQFIKKLPLGYNTPLNENASNLSGGQRQRLAIARALCQKPQLLIMDEATSNLDTITESAIKNTIFQLDSDLTCIIIAHRLSTIKNCDRIYVMDNGKIVESGTHTELMTRNKKYASLWNMQ